MKNNLFPLLLVSLFIGCTQQVTTPQNDGVDNKQTGIVQTDTVKSAQTKMEVFTSKTGAILKYVDFNLPKLKNAYSSVETRVRVLSSGGETGYFYQIEKQASYTTKLASIEYSDLLEVIKALSILKAEMPEDIASKPDYMENKFITVDGFKVGYYVNGEKYSWFLSLEKYGSENSVFIDDVNVIETAFIEAKNKIEELKSKKGNLSNS